MEDVKENGEKERGRCGEYKREEGERENGGWGMHTGKREREDWY